MLEIASQILICLLIAALIGFAIGYLVGKSQSQKSIPVLAEVPVEMPPVKEDTPPSNDIEIPTENAIEKALEALEEIEEQETEMTKVNEEESQKPELLSQPRNGVKDNLTQIKGIGPKLEEKLNESGIYHFEQIANWTESNMLWLEAHTLFASRVKKESWITEAKTFL